MKVALKFLTEAIEYNVPQQNIANQSFESFGNPEKSFCDQQCQAYSINLLNNADLIFTVQSNCVSVDKSPPDNND